MLADDGSFTGDTGCRQLEGSYTVEADRIVIAPIVIVGLPCDGQDLRPLQRQDRRLLALLDEAVAWRRSGETLTLADGAGSAILELRAWSSEGASVASAGASRNGGHGAASCRRRDGVAPPVGGLTRGARGSGGWAI